MTRRLERRDDGSYWLVARSEVTHDELGRTIQVVTDRFDEALPLSDPAAEYEDGPGPGRPLVEQFFHDAAGRVVAVVDPMGRRTVTVHDAVGRTIEVIDAVGNRITTQYDANGNPLRRDRFDLTPTGTEVFTWLGVYDDRDRLVAETDGLGNVTRHTHDSLDRRVQTTDPLGNVVEHEYDVFGRRVATIEHRTGTGRGDGPTLEPVITRTEYDRNGNAVAVIDALGRRTEQRLDALDRPIERIFPDGARIRTWYDRDGHVTRRREAHGALIVQTRDPLGRLVRTTVDASELDPDVTLEGAIVTTWRHDALDRVVEAGNERSTRTVAYDSVGNAWRDELRVDGSAPHTLLRETDDGGGVTALAYPGGRRVELTRDDLGRTVEISHVQDGDGYPGAPGGARLVARFDHIGSRRGSVELGNGTRTDRAYDAGGRLIELRHRGAGMGTDLLRLQYLHDGARTPRLRVDDGPDRRVAERFEHDSLYQVRRQWHEPGREPFDPVPLGPPSDPPTLPLAGQAMIDELIGPVPSSPPVGTWTHDRVGNRTSAGDPPVSYVANDLDQYVQIGDHARTYDRAGNLLADGHFVYRYDAAHRLTSVTHASTGAVVARYAYDPDGRRVVEAHGADEAIFVYDGPARIAEYAGDRTTAQYVHGDSLDEPLHVAADGVDRWLHADGLGSVRLLTAADGAILGQRRFGPFGEPLESDGEACAFGFTGRPVDPALGLYDFRARAYDPATGRFLQRDPAGQVDGTNLYAYTRNQPLRFADPLGLGRAERGDRPEQGETLVGSVKHEGVLDKAVSAYVGFMKAGLEEGVLRSHPTLGPAVEGARLALGGKPEQQLRAEERASVANWIDATGPAGPRVRGGTQPRVFGVAGARARSPRLRGLGQSFIEPFAKAHATWKRGDYEDVGYSGYHATQNAASSTPMRTGIWSVRRSPVRRSTSTTSPSSVTSSPMSSLGFAPPASATSPTCSTRTTLAATAARRSAVTSRP